MLQHFIYHNSVSITLLALSTSVSCSCPNVHLTSYRFLGIYWQLIVKVALYILSIIYSPVYLCEKRGQPKTTNGFSSFQHRKTCFITYQKSRKIPLGKVTFFMTFYSHFKKINIYTATLFMYYPKYSNLVSNDWSEHKE